MSTHSDSDADRLAEAFNYAFGEPVTAYLTDAVIVSCCGFGVMHRHVKAEPSGRFQDGHRLRTSDILQAEQCGPYWILRTLSGSFYVIVSFHPHGGRQSLEAFLKLREQGVHLTPHHLQ
ncbi:hypothetical protein [Stutzerimonas zhaodongensis]|uniref:hypothetical protein n=1 Tax=Stutzerimonas TaxID=2901164 RepID=UPI001F4EBDA3|nr:hypothetical protein [Stutzerimonas zhaodongensis]